MPHLSGELGTRVRKVKVGSIRNNRCVRFDVKHTHFKVGKCQKRNRRDKIQTHGNLGQGATMMGQLF